MTSPKELPEPFAVVAQALGCSSASLTLDSAMYRDHGWDSFGHLSVILALEQAYGIPIDDGEIEKYATMKAIQKLYEQALRAGDQRDS